MNNFPTLHTKRCILREISRRELSTLREIIEDEQFQRFLPELYDTVKTEEELLQLMRHFDTYVQNEDGALWGIETEDSLIGFVAIMDISYDPILFYALQPNYRNQGYAKEAVAEVVRYFKEKHHNPNLHTEVYKDNHASISILQSCGFMISSNEQKKNYADVVRTYTFCDNYTINRNDHTIINAL